MPGVMRNDHSALHGFSALLNDQIGNSLRRSADGQIIHPVRSGTDLAAQSCGSECQILPETILDLRFIITDGQEFLPQRIFFRQFLQPFKITIL